MQTVDAQQANNDDKAKQELISLSKQKWQWMADKNVDSLDVLFHKEAVFVHMGGAMNKEHELNTIKSGCIHYKHADIQETSVRFVGNTTKELKLQTTLTSSCRVSATMRANAM